MTALQIAGLFLGSSALGSIIVKLLDIWLDRRKRKDSIQDKEDTDTKRLDALEADMAALKTSQGNIEKKVDAIATTQMYQLKLELIKLAEKYIAKGSVTMAEKSEWLKLHSTYHSGLGGNGDLDLYKAEINNLEIITKG